MGQETKYGGFGFRPTVLIGVVFGIFFCPPRLGKATGPKGVYEFCSNHAKHNDMVRWAVSAHEIQHKDCIVILY